MEGEKREVVVSNIALESLQNIYDYGAQTFSIAAADVFIDELYDKIMLLSGNYYLYPKCRFISTKSGMYRNLIYGSYLVIYRITDPRIEVLNIIHSSRSMAKIKETTKIKID